MKIKGKKYGFIGWEEFLENRKEILDEFDQAFRKNKNRPVRTSHGESGEAIFREKLSEILPKRFGVTSGYIIPDLIAENYCLYHYDVIIYDKLNSPVLWAEYNKDDSSNGKRMAIPAKYIFSVFEVKASFEKKTIKDAINKLTEINKISSFFPPEFTTGVLFFQLRNGVLKKSEILKEFVEKIPFNFWGGAILRSELNEEMTGFLELSNSNSETFIKENHLAKNIDDLNPSIKDGGGLIIPPNTAIGMYKSNFGKIHYTKYYMIGGPVKNGKSILLNWSYSNFSNFMLRILSNLEGKNSDSKNKATYGKVFDVFDKVK